MRCPATQHKTNFPHLIASNCCRRKGLWIVTGVGGSGSGRVESSSRRERGVRGGRNAGLQKKRGFWLPSRLSCTPACRGRGAGGADLLSGGRLGLSTFHLCFLCPIQPPETGSSMAKHQVRWAHNVGTGTKAGSKTAAGLHFSCWRRNQFD